jgi:hypothetical protein
MIPLCTQLPSPLTIFLCSCRCRGVLYFAVDRTGGGSLLVAGAHEWAFHENSGLAAFPRIMLASNRRQHRSLKHHSKSTDSRMFPLLAPTGMFVYPATDLTLSDSVKEMQRNKLTGWQLSQPTLCGGLGRALCEGVVFLKIYGSGYSLF